jgi:hypothetical protein
MCKGVFKGHGNKSKMGIDTIALILLLKLSHVFFFFFEGKCLNVGHEIEPCFA